MDWKNYLGWILLGILLGVVLAGLYIGGGIAAILVILGCVVALFYLSIWLIVG
jgi:hypothetical protein